MRFFLSPFVYLLSIINNYFSMKKTLYLFILLCLPLSIFAGGKAKYVFFFIGDGMGVDHVNGTEMYLAEKEGVIGTEALLFSKFPIMSVATTYSMTNSVTDSSAGGTALSTGEKTYNGAIGVDFDKKPLKTVAERAKSAGNKVGIITSVSIDHATPAAFYAHQPDRDMYYEIAHDLVLADFDFYGGAGFLKADETFEGEKAPSIYQAFDNAGYKLYKGLNDYTNSKRGEKIILMQEEGKDVYSLPYAIDRKEGDLSLEQITKAAIDHLSDKNKKGFFLMVEGGKIDWSSHDNDAATTFAEVVDFDNAIAHALDFYKKHPKETLIVITADHETGGLALGTGKYELNLRALEHQEVSAGELSNLMSVLRKTKNNNVTWDDMKEFLSEYMGFWDELQLTWAQERKLRDEFESSFVSKKHSFEESMYTKTEPLASRAKEVMNEIAMVAWASHSHSANYVPVYAIGVGAEMFSAKQNNIDIPRKIAKAAGYKW